MSDREEREKVIAVLLDMYRWLDGAQYIVATHERIHAIAYAIASIKTDLKYDLMYEEALEQESTTKNDLPHCQYTDEEIAKSFIEDVEAVKEQLPNKDNLGVDCISRTQTQTEIEMHASRYTISRERGYMGHVEWSDQLIKVSDAVDIIRNLPSVTPQEPKSEWEHDHEILKAYSDGQASIITVLEAIKAEIEQSRYGLINDGLDVALKIIDKHISEMGDMAEIEPQESEG